MDKNGEPSGPLGVEAGEANSLQSEMIWAKAKTKVQHALDCNNWTAVICCAMECKEIEDKIAEGQKHQVDESEEAKCNDC